ncbi:MAG: RimK family alpha-L-glutamate ligase [Candidatus Hodarchaeota archaeon]
MKVAILTPRASAPVSRSIIDALKNRSVTVMKLNPGRVSLDLSGDQPDIVKKYFTEGEPRGGIIRGIGTKKIKKIYHRLGLLKLFEECGVYLVNSRECLEIATNKALTSYKLIKSRLPTPRTILCEGFKSAIEAFKMLGEDVILKPLFGSKGVGVMRLFDEGLATNIFYNLDRMDEVFYLQEFQEHGNEDIRAMVLGDEVLCAMKRVSADGSKNVWKTNVFVGATGKHVDLNEELQEIAVKAAHAVNGEFVGVDLMETPDGPSIVEVNAVPGFNELQKTTSINIAQEFVDYFLEYLKK